MAGTNGQWKSILAGVAVVMVTGVLLLGLNGSVQTLQTKVGGLDARMAQLDALGTHIDKLQAQVNQIAGVRADILQAICVANARGRADLRRCLHHASQ